MLCPLMYLFPENKENEIGSPHENVAISVLYIEMSKFEDRLWSIALLWCLVFFFSSMEWSCGWLLCFQQAPEIAKSEATYI